MEAMGEAVEVQGPIQQVMKIQASKVVVEVEVAKSFHYLAYLVEGEVERVGEGETAKLS